MENGIWRTVGGRRIFIKEGQELADAMKESGKFGKKEIEQSNIEFGSSTLTEELTKEDKQILEFYVKDAGAYDINAVLRDKIQPNDADNVAINDLDNALNKATLNEDIELYRYVSDENVFRNLKVGDDYEEKAYMSTTKNANSDRESNYMDYKVKMVIKGKQGDKALDVSPLYDKDAYEGSEESEVIYSRNQKIRLVNADKVVDGQLYSKMTDKQKSVYRFFDRYIYEFETIE